MRQTIFDNIFWFWCLKLFFPVLFASILLISVLQFTFRNRIAGEGWVQTNWCRELGVHCLFDLLSI